LSCKDYEGDYYYHHYDYVDYDYYYHDNDDSACQGYRYDFDLIIGIKPTNSSTSDVPFTYCTQSRVVPSLGNKIVDQWMEEVRTFAAASQRTESANSNSSVLQQELLEVEDAKEYCEHFPASWTVPATSYADFLYGTDQYDTCFDIDFGDLFFMGFLENCSENEDPACSLSDKMVQQCTVSKVNAKLGKPGTEFYPFSPCAECKAMTVSGVTGCYCECHEDDFGTDAPAERVFSKVESDVVIIAQFEEWWHEPASTSYEIYYEGNNCYGGHSSFLFGVISLVNAILSAAVCCLTIRKRLQWTQLHAAIKSTTEDGRSGGGSQMMEMTQMAQGQGTNFVGGQVHPMNAVNQQPQQPMFVQLPNGQIGQMVPVQPVTAIGGGMMTAGGQGQGQGSSLAPPNYQPTIVATAVVMDDGSVKM
jgi:hypothetical protein